MTERRSIAPIVLIAGAAIAGAALLAFGGFTLLNKGGAASQQVTGDQLAIYNGVWVDEDGAWHRILFMGDRGILRTQVVDVRFSLTSRDKDASADTFAIREGLTGQTTTAVLVLQEGPPKRLTVSTEGGTSTLTYLKSLDTPDAALLVSALNSSGKPLVEQMAGDQQATAPAPPASPAGTQTLDFVTDPGRKADLERQLTTDGYQTLRCIVGADAPLKLEDGRYLTSTATAPPACGNDTGAAFVFDLRTGMAAVLIDSSSGGDDLQEHQHGNPDLVIWLQGRYADGE
ncbi:MAG: hypothetical protein KA105_06910 [Caulobacter sp.]|nr:hypothetical protein [Caulobacter sp.]